MSYTPGTDPGTPAKDDKVYESLLSIEDIAATQLYEERLRATTLDLTGREVQSRLARIEAEFARMAEVSDQLARLKRITKSALLGPLPPERRR